MNKSTRVLSRKEARKLGRINKKAEKHNNRYNKPQKVTKTEDINSPINPKNNPVTTAQKRKKQRDRPPKTKTEIPNCTTESADDITLRRLEKALSIPREGKNRFASFRNDGFEDILEICSGNLEVTEDMEVIEDAEVTEERPAEPPAPSGLRVVRTKLTAALNRLSARTSVWVAVQLDELLVVCSSRHSSLFLAEGIMERLAGDVLHEQIVLDLSSVLPHISSALFLRQLVAMAVRGLLLHSQRAFLLFLASCVHLGTLSPGVMLEVLREVGREFSEWGVECLVLALSWVGPLLLAHPQTAALITSAASRAPPSSTFSRVEFMAEVLREVEGSGDSAGIPHFGFSVAAEFFSRPPKKTKLVISDSLEAILSSTEGVEAPQNFQSLAGFEFSDKLILAAKKQNLKSDLQRTIFCIIMSGHDFLDSSEKLRRLSLNDKVEREIVNVAVLCCLREKTYNPYYGHLLTCLGRQKRSFVVAFKLRLAEEMAGEHMALLAADVVCAGEMSVVSVLKNVDFMAMGEGGVAFLRWFVWAVLRREGGVERFGVLGRRGDLVGLGRCLRVFLRTYMGHLEDCRAPLERLLLSLNV